MNPPSAVEVFQHIRVILAIILGLGITRLLNGVARIVQNPKEHKVYWVHIGWVLTLLLILVHFWWWEFFFEGVKQWSFELYFFLIAYVIVLFMLCAVICPDSIGDYADYEEFFISRRKWFFSIFAFSMVFDVVDTLIKGHAHYAPFETEYIIRVCVYLVVCGLAFWTPNRRFHEALVLGGLVYEISWIVRLFDTIR